MVIIQGAWQVFPGPFQSQNEPDDRKEGLRDHHLRWGNPMKRIRRDRHLGLTYAFETPTPDWRYDSGVRGCAPNMGI